MVARPGNIGGGGRQEERMSIGNTPEMLGLGEQNLFKGEEYLLKEI